jgi:paired amphipathic helix protein Sin3a
MAGKRKRAAPKKGKAKGKAMQDESQKLYQTVSVHSQDELDTAKELHTEEESNDEANTNGEKRAKIHHTKPPTSEVASVSPSLVPQPPEPLPPLPAHTTPEDFQFFDRVKKYISNKSVYNEFLKFTNLYSNDLLDKYALLERAQAFIGGNPELFSYMKRMIQAEDGKNDVFTPKAKAASSRIALSHCRGLGPSYRLLPKRERLKACSGRDDLCNEVLNDDWASHPTWASEDSGFVAHRKNTHEELLHRIEEERHDYDYNIEACYRTIQLIEPIVLNLKHMTQEERDNYVLHKGLGGQSETIYQRVIKKIYDRERGQKVIDDMFARPAAVLPVVLLRLNQKLEEWKAGQVRCSPSLQSVMY